MNARRRRSLQNFSNAVSRLDEALALVSQQSEPPDLLIDGAIQRFEFVIELAWKNMKRALQEEGVEALTPRESIS
ncbi:MAG: nucleotidyltransferase substrate binding protein, partial [Acidobacteriota bacterium]